MLTKHPFLSPWLAGLISITLALVIQPGLRLAAFFIAATFFAP